MVTSLNNQTPAREAGYEMVQYIAARATVAAGVANRSVKMGTLPAGSIIVAVVSRVATAVTGGTPAAGIGLSTGAANELSGALTVTAGSTFAAPATTTGGPLATDTDVWLNVSGGATAGDVIGGVLFIKPLA
jgi:pyruvoyl-dependent arginine decarboxylase (PvlArgDC)